MTDMRCQTQYIIARRENLSRAFSGDQKKKEYYKNIKFVTIDKRFVLLYNEEDRSILRLLIDAQHDGGNGHRFGINGVYAVDMLVSTVTVFDSGGIGACR